MKNLLANKYGVVFDTMEQWTLGRTKNELENRNLRPDFIILLESVIDYRNYVAHELLANQALISGLVSDYDGRFEIRELEKGIFELEQLVLLFDWCQEHNAWD